MEKVRLGDIAKVIIGISAPKIFIDKNESNAVPFIRAGLLENLCNGEYKFVEYLDKEKYKTVPKNTIIFAKSGMSVLKDRVFCLKEESIIVGHLAGIICSSQIYYKYLEYYLKYNKPSILNQNDSYPSIRAEDIENIILMLPDIEKQKEISNKLDYLKNIINIRKKQIEKMDELIKSQFVVMFGDIQEYKKLEEYSILITKGASPKWQGIDYKSNGTLFVTSENVREGYIDITKPKYLDNRINEILPRSVLKKDDILINIVGASIGRAGKYNYDYLANINQAVALVRTKNINNVFLLQYLNSEQAIKMYNDMKKGGARENLSLRNIADLKIPKAPIELQNKFAEFVKQVDKQKFEIQKNLEKTQKLQQSLMNKYFN